MKKMGSCWVIPRIADTNQILTLYSESDKEFKGIGSDKSAEELWMEVHGTVQKAMIRGSPKKRNSWAAKWLWRLQMLKEEREPEEKEEILPIESVPKNSKER